jgi:NAD(P)-dependent dehydrogenase (short-subunit alcohol dehydrogenase family)
MDSDVWGVSDRVALVTGGSTGIGLGIAQALVSAGASVCICARDTLRLTSAADVLRQTSDRVLEVQCDTTIESSVSECFARCVDRFGRIDACFANSGVDGVSPLTDMPIEEWRRVVTGNLDSAFLTIREATRYMLAQGTGGSLVAVSSVAALGGRKHRAHYVAAKAGIVGLMRSVAMETGHLGIRANVIMPGSVETEMSRAAPDWVEIRRRVSERTPLGRPGQINELGGIALYLMSDLSSFQTGSVISVDGGMSIA